MFISYFHLFNYLFVSECNFFNAPFITKAVWDTMLVSGIGQSSHRLLCLLIAGQCKTVLLAETLLCEGKNQYTLILFPSRICFFLAVK